MDKYNLVSCDFHDRLEELATLRQACLIVYSNSAEESVEVHGLIVDVFAFDGADFLKLKDGTQIRLDKIISIDGQLVSTYGGIE